MRKFSMFTGLLALIAALIATTITPAAVAETVSVKSKTSKLRPGSLGWVEARAEGVSSCRLRIGSRQRTVRVSPEHRYEVEFSYRINRRARPGRYRATLACGTETKTWGLSVRKQKGKKKRTYRSLLRGNIRATTSQIDQDEFADLPDLSQTPAKQYTPDSPEVTTKWQEIVSQHHSVGATRGGCNGWTWLKRPDLYEKVERFHLAKWYNETGGRGTYTISDGLGWPQRAAEAGLTTDPTPVPGSIVFWPPSSYDPDGHFAFVESVDATAGTFSISEYMNDGGPVVPNYRTLSFSAIAEQGGLLFIR